jgi:hypothetical protein
MMTVKPAKGRYRLFLAVSIFAMSIYGCSSSDRPDENVDNTAQAPIVVVLNGCGTSGAARAVAEAIRDAGWDIGNGHGENADSFDYPNTIVVDYVGDRDKARLLADALGATMVQQVSHDPDRFGTIGVVVGADFRIRATQLRAQQRNQLGVQ